MSGPWTVAVYLVDRADGGTEEGGWHYDRGEPAEEYAEHTRGFREEAAADEYAAVLNGTYGHIWNEGRREISSVLSTGRYQAEAREGNPKAWPAIKPHYE